LNCTIQKGEFDYDLGNDWNKMSDMDQTKCIQYLKGDVLGLKELSERMNKECFENFNINLYKYLSTSQLTYSVWVNRLYTQTKEPIYLQTPEQEKFFQESIYGMNE
jgi:DNA polymerase type B, organellar and viral